MENIDREREKGSTHQQQCFCCFFLARNGLLWKVSQLESVTHTHTQTQSTHTYVHPHTPSHKLTEQIRLSLSLSLPLPSQYSHCLRCDEYIISVNNMAVPTRYAALPYHFQLDEHGVRAGLVENMNTMRETEKGKRERERGRMHEESGRECEWVVKKKNTRGR